MAFQNPALLPWRTTLRNLLLPLEIVEPYRSRIHREREAFESDARRLLAATGLADFADQYPWMLSGGMRQRASLCRALIHRPPLLLLDEPFAALDAFTREELWGVLQKIWEERRRFTSIMVTHDLREAAFLADVVFVMSARPGRIVSVHDVTLPRPRTIDATFAPEFIQLVRSLRSAVEAG
jgi:NitT/TauT family transport system ATP-binding protein